MVLDALVWPLKRKNGRDGIRPPGGDVLRLGLLVDPLYRLTQYQAMACRVVGGCMLLSSCLTTQSTTHQQEAT
jgi:hypothetical protein